MKKKLMFIVLIAFILFSVSSVAASDVNDTAIANDENDFIAENDIDDLETSSDDENQPVGDINDLLSKEDNGTYTALQLKIALASEGSTLNLTNDYKYNDEFKITTGIFIDKDITIDGNGHSIDGMGQSRIFHINYGDGLKHHKVTLKNITFKNGNAKIYGGAILNFADLTIDNCYFTNNNAGTAGGAVNSLGALTLKNSVFDKNSAGGDAGAVFSLTFKKSLEFYKEYFADHNASEDTNLLFSIAMQAALEHGTDTISNCIFTNNIANGRGGGAVYAFSHIDINSCTFNFNKAGEKGAGVFACKDLHIKNSKFSKNTVSMYGGAVYFKCHEQTGHYEDGKWVSSIKYYNCLIEGSTFAYNVASERGGAIYGFRTSSSDTVHCAKAVKCTFSDNNSPKGKNIYGGTLTDCISKNTKLTINKVIVKKSAPKIVLKATLKKGATPLKDKIVTFKFNGKTFKTKTNSKGIAIFNVYKSTLSKLKLGAKVQYQVSYGRFTDKRATTVIA